MTGYDIGDTMVDYKIGVVGYGVVGQAVAEVFREKGDEVKWNNKDKGTPLLELAEWSDIIFLTLPTPTDFVNEKYDLSIFHSVIEQLIPVVQDTEKIIVIKSTVVPGTTQSYINKYPNVKFAFNPEFLTAATPVDDFRNEKRIVVGTNWQGTMNALCNFYEERFPNATVYETTATEAELIKYMGNVFLATKVIVANEFKDICDTLNADYNVVAMVVGDDHRIGHSHLKVTEQRGFSGMCFPKDIIALRNKADEIGVNTDLLKTVWEKNKRIRNVHDWGKK